MKLLPKYNLKNGDRISVHREHPTFDNNSIITVVGVHDKDTVIGSCGGRKDNFDLTFSDGEGFAWSRVELELTKPAKIERLQNQIKEITAEIERLSIPEEYVLKGGNHCIVATGQVYPIYHSSVVMSAATEFGAVRDTQQLAESAALKMRAFNRILAFVDDHDGPTAFKTHAILSRDGHYFSHDVSGFDNVSPTTIRMSYNTAQKLVIAINNGSFTL